MKHNLYILSDDIHSELVTKAHKHTFISMISLEIRDRSFVFTSPTKAFILACPRNKITPVLENLKEKFA